MGHHRKLFPCYDQYSRYIKEFIDIIKEHEDYLCQEYCSRGWRHHPVKILNIPFTHLLKSWIVKTGMSGSWSQDPGLISNEFTNIDKGKKRIKIKTNVVLPGGCVISVCWTRSISDSRELKWDTWKTIIIKVGKSHQVITVFKLRAKERKYYHSGKGYFNTFN